MLWACVQCSARYSVGAPCCPQCGSTSYREAPGGAVEESASVLDSAHPAEPPAGAGAPVKGKSKNAEPTSVESSAPEATS